MTLRLGNDVVDFAEPGNIASAANPAFHRRVLSATERAHPQAGTAPYLWAHWAAKEAAYKALKPTQPALVFAHRQFEVTSTAAFEMAAGQGTGTVQVGPDRLDVTFVWTPDWVHCVTAHQPAALHGVAELDPLRCEPRFDTLTTSERLKDESIGARVLAYKLLAQRGCGDARIQSTTQISGRAGRPLVVGLDGQPLSATLSLSHDGRFVAAALR